MKIKDGVYTDLFKSLYIIKNDTIILETYYSTGDILTYTYKWNEKDDIYVNPEDKNEYFTVFGYENNNYLTFFGDNYFIALSKKS